MFKIQAKANNDNPHLVPAPPDILQWVDMQGIPRFNTREQAEAWLAENKLSSLSLIGVEFRVTQA